MLLKKQVLIGFYGTEVLGQMVKECTEPSELQNSKGNWRNVDKA